MNYYNEHDAPKAAWLRELIKANIIAQGVVDERSIEDIDPAELAGYTQCHFFAGIGVWSYALRLAGWPDNRPVWTGSCPCQPFSQAGQRAGFDDPRHLWPTWFRLIRKCRPGVIFGEQVAKKSGLAWLDLVFADLENQLYATAPFNLCAGGFGAPNIRQRLFFVADRLDDTSGQGLSVCERETLERARRRDQGGAAEQSGGASGGMGHAERIRSRRDTGTGARTQSGPEVWNVGNDPGPSGIAGGLANAGGEGSQKQLGTGSGRGLCKAPGLTENCGAIGLADATIHGRGEQRKNAPGSQERSRQEELEQRSGSSGIFAGDGRPGPVNGFWADADWIFCRDNKWRPVKPGIEPLAHGVAARILRLRGYGDAVNAQVAAEFISAYLHVKNPGVLP